MTGARKPSVLFPISGWLLAVASGVSVWFADDARVKIVSGLGTIVGVLLGVAGRIAQDLLDRWAKDITDWLDRRARLLVSNYRQRYYDHLYYRHHDFDVKGLSTQGIYALEIDRVFVELSIAPQSADGASRNPIQPPANMGNNNTIREYLKRPEHFQHLAILGAPGSGKTTLLKHLTISLVGRRSRRPLKAVPILLFLRDHVASIEAKPDLSITDLVRERLQKEQGPLPPIGWFEQEFDRGRCLVMLDGLDEMADPLRRRTLCEWVETQKAALRRNRLIVTSRPFGYRDNPLSGVTVLEVRSFTIDQVRQFVSNWYFANELMAGAGRDDPGVRMKASEGAQDLFRRILNSPALTELAVNPLLLTMIATVHRYRSTLPGRRVELYSEVCDVFLGKHQQARGVELELSPSQKKRVLMPLAWHMMLTEAREVSLSDAVACIEPHLRLVSPHKMEGAHFLQMIEESSGLLLERENGRYTFAHLTFQEYL